MTIRRFFTGLALLAFVTVLPGVPAVGQTTGSIDGIVSDSGGTPLPGARVEAKSPSLQGVRSVVSDSSGRYRIAAIPPGTYTVTAALSGFKSVQRTGVVVTLDATSNVPFRLDLSKAAEVVVTGEMPMVDTQSTTSGLNIREEVARKLPEGRNKA